MGMTPTSPSASRSAASERPPAARPLALSPCKRPADGAQIMAKKSPPGPHMYGSVSASMAFMASAASTAEPPSARMSRPARLASS